jgi:hypothetical protein
MEKKAAHVQRVAATIPLIHPINDTCNKDDDRAKWGRTSTKSWPILSQFDIASFDLAPIFAIILSCVSYQ